MALTGEEAERANTFSNDFTTKMRQYSGKFSKMEHEQRNILSLENAAATNSSDFSEPCQEDERREDQKASRRASHGVNDKNDASW